MEPIQEERNLPRFCKEFIGIGHELEKKKRQRRRIELEERAVANRVLYLQKQQNKAQRSLVKKRQQLSQMMKIAERQAHENNQKQRILLERQRQVQLAREENHLRRIMHKQNLQRQENDLYRRNSLDYQMGKQQLKQGQNRKKQERREDLLTRRQRYMTLNMKKDQGRSKVDKFFKKKNFEHTMTYKSMIQKEDRVVSSKVDTIKKLTEIQEVLRKKLEQSTQRNSQMDQIIGNMEHSFRERSKSRSRLSSRLSLNKTTLDHHHQDPTEPTLITSVEGELLMKKTEIDEKIDESNVAEGGFSEESKVHRRRRNKHANRYKQYQQF